MQNIDWGEVMRILNMHLSGAYTMLLLITCMRFAHMGSNMHKQISVGIALWVMCCLPTILNRTELGLRVPLLKEIQDTLDLVCVPTAAIITNALTGMRKSKWFYPMHIGPFVLFIVLTILTHERWPFHAALIYSAIYLVVVVTDFVRTVIRYNRYVLWNYSNLEGRNLTWIPKLVFLLPFILATFALSTLYTGSWTRTVYYVYAIFSWWIIMVFLGNQREVHMPLRREIDMIEDDFRPLTPDKVAEVFPFIDDVERLVLDPRYFKNPNVTLADFCEELNLKPEELTRYFVQQVGGTFYDIINQQRLTHACELLISSNLNIKQIVRDSGYETVEVFQKVFKKSYGKTPEEFRSNQ